LHVEQNLRLQPETYVKLYRWCSLIVSVTTAYTNIFRHMVRNFRVQYLFL